ncbi:MAG: hypothetical protein ACI9SC_002079 [Gammaproteobacteria bacterium]|jgi:uncharacterized protein (DUF2141 family)
MDTESNLKITTLHLVKLICFSILGFSISTTAIASEELDIQPNEAANVCEIAIAQVRVTVNNVGSGGILTVELYDDPDNFLNKKGRKQRIRIPAAEGSHEVCFDIEEQGTYAVAAYHDVDGDRKLKKRWNMTPKEPFGLSNNPKLKFGFPKFSASAFTTDTLGADISIDLQEL